MRLRRLTLIGSLGATSIAMSAPAATAQQAAVATTMPATGVTSTSAVLNGSINTGGQQTEWQFEYGTSTSYNQATPLQTIPPGGGTVKVSTTLGNILTPNTTYHFRLVAISGIGSAYLEIDHGADLTFTTQPTGSLLLVSRRLIVSKGFVNVALMCKSAVGCGGRYTINTTAKLAKTHKLGTVLCATTPFSVPANATKSVKSHVRAGCLALLRRARGRRITGTFSAGTISGQSGLVKSVTLILK